MKIFELFSGFIAAIVIALGAGLYVNQDTSVGEELVVEEEVRVEAWFVYIGPDFGQPGYDPTDSNLYVLYDSDPTNEPTCQGLDQICAVKTEIDDPNATNPLPDQDSLDDMKSQLEELQEDHNIKLRNISH